MKIELTDSKLTDEEIHVACEHTLWVRVNQVEEVCMEELERDVKALGAKCRQLGVSFFRKGFRDVKDQFEFYRSECERYRTLYSQLKDSWREIIAEGIYAPTTQNEKIVATRPVYFKLLEMHYRSSILSRVVELRFSIQRFLNSDLRGYSKISI